ncbi:helix-turn-helix domain-containing protein [Tissierella praeacuta]|uniref:helix-turn-helix domain-containing protein n=1 Tax=Tissierella praeacuta TaxID=43131 RepID=UPI003DA60848
MTTNVKFGECLSFLLSTLDISMSQLAKAINVDSSLVNRWANGKRIPAYNTVYIESITEYLSKNIKNSFQEQHINELFMKVCKNDEFNGNIIEKTRKVLLESQGYSIECKKKEQKQKKEQSINEKQTSNLLDIKQIHSHNHDNINFSNQTIALSDEDKIIFGIENIVSACISLLEIAANQEHEDNKIIYITYNMNKINTCYKLIYWRKTLLKAINNGWEIIVLLRLDNNINRIMEFIDFIYPIIITGKLKIYYFNNHDTYLTNREIYIVSGIGALSCFPENLGWEMNCGFYLKNKSGIDILKNYFNKFLADHTHPIVKYYSKHTEYYNDLVEFEENIGNRFQYKYCFSMLMLTNNLFQKFLKKKKVPNNEGIMALNIHKRRFNTFLSNIQYYKYTDIYLTNSIKYLIIDKKFHFDYSTGTEIINLEIEDIIEILQNIIYLLETYDNFNIAFMPQNAVTLLKNPNSYCTVKDRHYILFKTFNSPENISEIQLSIEEHMIVKTFNEYFKQTLKQIAPVNKEKSQIIKMLQYHIDILNK